MGEEREEEEGGERREKRRREGRGGRGGVSDRDMNQYLWLHDASVNQLTTGNESIRSLTQNQ